MPQFTKWNRAEDREFVASFDQQANGVYPIKKKANFIK